MRCLVILVLSLGLFLPSVTAEELSFAGLSRRTTGDQLKKRYPTSSMVGNFMYVSNADSHDHIYGIGIPGTDPSGSLRPKRHRGGCYVQRHERDSPRSR